jgi:RHS repeat-associated protein
VVTTSYYLGGQLVATREGNTLRYVHQDSLGSTSLMTDSSGAQIGTTMKYYPFGAVISGSVSTDKKFTGQRLDSTGLYYYNARYYDPQIGRFISADTVIQSQANPQCFNRYSYCLNNPLRYTDPTGNIIDTIYDANILAAWELFVKNCSDIANILIMSDMVFTFGLGGLDANTLAQTEVDTNNSNHIVITFNSELGVPDINRYAFLMSHEIVHAISYTIPDHEKGGSQYEETIAFQFMYWFANKIGYKPGSGDSASGTFDHANKAMKVDLRQEIGSKGLDDDLDAAWGDKSGYGKLSHFGGAGHDKALYGIFGKYHVPCGWWEKTLWWVSGHNWGRPY